MHCTPIAPKFYCARASNLAHPPVLDANNVKTGEGGQARIGTSDLLLFRIAPNRFALYLMPNERHLMRSETERTIEEIKRALALLRRHL
jgi:hypothetical protein